MEAELIDMRAEVESSRLLVIQATENQRAAEVSSIVAAASPRFDDNSHSPNPSLDPPSRLSVIANVTPKRLLRSMLSRLPATPATFTPASAAMSNTRQPRFTPTTDSIPEENADSSSGGGSMLHSSMELLGRAIVAAESEKRVIKSKLLKKSMSKYKLLRLLSKFMLSSMTCSNMIIAAVADYCSEMTLHQLMTLGLLLYSSADKLRPLVAIVINKLSSAMLRFASDRTKSACTCFCCCTPVLASLEAHDQGERALQPLSSDCIIDVLDCCGSGVTRNTPCHCHPHTPD